MDRKQKLYNTMIAKHGSLSKWKEFMAKNGRKGGSAKVPKGFSVTSEIDPERHKRISSDAGKKSRRTK